MVDDPSRPGEGDPPFGVGPTGRPWPGPPTIGVEAELEILQELLAVERERLVVARRIEEERSIVFPETTVIVRDIERLLGKVMERQHPSTLLQNKVEQHHAVPTRPERKSSWASPQK